MFLDPGERHPNAPCSPSEMERRLRVPAGSVAAWAADGLPLLPDGRIDPFTVVSWLSWGRLDRAPVLGRRWRSWLRWFTTPARRRRLTIRRAQSCFLPAPAAMVWDIPDLADGPGQRVLATQWDEGEAVGTMRRLHRPVAAEHSWHAEDEVELFPLAAPSADDEGLRKLVRDLAGAFTYAYRRHRAGEQPAWTGTCLDLARLCGAELGRLGRPWRLVSGVVAHAPLANAHFWVESEGTPLDPTIPAVARMLGGDWQALVPLAVGRHDARRIRVAAADGPVDDTLGGIGGRLDADRADALYCTDWAVGECGWGMTPHG